MSTDDQPSGEPADQPDRSAELPFTRLDSGPSGDWWHWMLDLDPFAPATVPTGPGAAPPPAPTEVAPAPRPTPAIEPPRLVSEEPSRARALVKLLMLAVVLGVSAAVVISAVVLMLIALFGPSGS